MDLIDRLERYCTDSGLGMVSQQQSSQLVSIEPMCSCTTPHAAGILDHELEAHGVTSAGGSNVCFEPFGLSQSRTTQDSPHPLSCPWQSPCALPKVHDSMASSGIAHSGRSLQPQYVTPSDHAASRTFQPQPSSNLHTSDQATGRPVLREKWPFQSSSISPMHIAYPMPDHPTEELRCSTSNHSPVSPLDDAVSEPKSGWRAGTANRNYVAYRPPLPSQIVHAPPGGAPYLRFHPQLPSGMHSYSTTPVTDRGYNGHPFDKSSCSYPAC